MLGFVAFSECLPANDRDRFIGLTELQRDLLGLASTGHELRVDHAKLEVTPGVGEEIYAVDIIRKDTSEQVGIMWHSSTDGHGEQTWEAMEHDFWVPIVDAQRTT